MLPFYSSFTTQAPAICVLDNPTQFSPGKCCLEFLHLSQPTVVSDLLSHSRGRQRVEPILKGLATSSGRGAEMFLQNAALFTHLANLLLPFPVLYSKKWQCPQNQTPSKPDSKTDVSPGLLPRRSGTHLLFCPSHGACSFICRKEVQGESQMGIQKDSSTYEFKNLHVLLPHLCLTSCLSNRARI